MKSYIVLFRWQGTPSEIENPHGFVCFADDADHAEQQCENAYPGCDVVWVFQGGETAGGYAAALMGYYNNGLEAT